MLVRRELDGAWASPWWISAHTHALLVGFVMMMILGVALWMFPRPARDDTRFNLRVVEGAYWMLTIGTGTRVAGELFRSSSDAPMLRWSVLAAGLFQIAGILFFFATMWTRIR